MRKDHKVSFKSFETIEGIASKIRRSLVKSDFRGFDVVEYLLSLQNMIIPKKGSLSINFFQMENNGIPAKVTFNPLTLHVDTEIWAEAKIGEPGARRILAHELGHILLHDHYALPFSGEKGDWLRDEESAEWQADRFADCILISIEELIICLPASSLAIEFGVEIEVINRRFKQKYRHLSGYCSWCSGLTRMLDANTFKCEICGSSGCV